MIGSDTPMALCVHVCGHTGTLVKVINLGYATLDGNELDRLNAIARNRGWYLSLMPLEEEPIDINDLVRELQFT